MRAVALFVQPSLIVPYGDEEDVAEVVASRSAEVGVAESIDILVGVVVSRAAVPVAGHRPRVGAQLHHTERPGGARERMPVEIRPDEGVDVSGVVRRCRGGEAGEQQGGEEDDAFHTIGCKWPLRGYRHLPPAWPSWCRTSRRCVRREACSRLRSRSPSPSSPPGLR